MKNKVNYYTLMFIPEDNGKTFTLRVHKFVVRSLVLFFIIFIVCLMILLFNLAVISAKLQLLNITRNENIKLTQENKHLRQVTNELNKIEILSNYLNKLAYPPSITKRAENLALEKSEISEGSVIRDSIINEDIAEYPNQTLSLNQIKENINTIPNITPVDGWITRSYLQDTSTSIDKNIHGGIDFAATLGTPIKATASGLIEEVNNDKYLGLLIMINHENGFITKYGHCSQVLVQKHDRVKKGQTIALVGNTGRSTAPHLHYELIKDGNNVNPSKYLLTHN